MYFIPGTAGHANIYKNAKGKKLEQFNSHFLNSIIPEQVDFGASIFPKGKFSTLDSPLQCFILNDTSDVLSIPKWWAACTVANNIVFWKEHSSGGHFPSVEKPDELVQDIRDFTNMFNGSKMRELTKAGS
jgi:hypothetical protein